MDVYLRLPGHAGSSNRLGYRDWLEVHELRFERPVLEKEVAVFTVFRVQDALTHVLLEQARSGRRFDSVRIHRVEGHEALGRLRFDRVRVSQWAIDGSAELAMECVQFEAERWQPE